MITVFGVGASLVSYQQIVVQEPPSFLKIVDLDQELNTFEPETPISEIPKKKRMLQNYVPHFLKYTSKYCEFSSLLMAIYSDKDYSD